MSPRYISPELRNQVRERADGCCEYCLLAEEDAFFPHEPDHIIAKKHGAKRFSKIFASLVSTAIDLRDQILLQSTP